MQVGNLTNIFLSNGPNYRDRIGGTRDERKLQKSHSEVMLNRRSRADDVEVKCDEMRMKIKRTLSMGNLRAMKHMAKCKRQFAEEGKKCAKNPSTRHVLAISIVDRIRAMYGGGFTSNSSHAGAARTSQQPSKRRMLTGAALLRALMNDGLHSKLSGIPVTSSGTTGKLARNAAF
jgi:hypothetical protein